MNKKAKDNGVAGYVRVSTRQQNGRMQEDAIAQWAQAKGIEVTLYRDKATGKNMDRPGWTKLEAAVRQGKVRQIVVWKLDRLGRTVSGLAKLFDDLRDRDVKLVSLTEGMDLSSPMGKLVGNVLASIAEFETELRGERVASGQAAARKRGKRWGGSRKGWTKLSAEQVQTIRKLHTGGTSKRSIAKMLGLSWPTIHKVCEVA
jgi:DNA invertase Pin-like site-specific DNA recombinase